MDATIILDDEQIPKASDENINRSGKRNANIDNVNAIDGNVPKKPRFRNRGANAPQLDKENQPRPNIPGLLDVDCSAVKNGAFLPAQAHAEVHKQASSFRDRVASNNVGRAEHRANQGEPCGNQGEPFGNQVEFRGDQAESRGNQAEPLGNHGEYRGNQAESRGNQVESRGNHGEYRGNQGEYRGNQVESRGNQGEYRGNHAEYRGNQGDPHLNQGDYRGNQLDFRGSQAESRGNHAGYRGHQGNQQTNHRGNNGELRGKYRGSRGSRVGGGGGSGGGNGFGGVSGVAGSDGGSGGGLGGRFSLSAHNFNNHSYRNDEFHVIQKLRSMSGPTLLLEPIVDEDEIKFSSRNRLYVGNLSDIRDEEGLRELFKPYGELGDIFLSPDKKYAFVKVDYFINAEKAKRALDGTMVNGRQLRVRFSNNATVLRVSNLSHLVSNELLYKAFEIFGPVERAIITVDDRGNHMGEGTVEFSKKSSATTCLRMCQEKCFFLTASLRPCVVEPKELIENVDGLPEKVLVKNNQFNQERSFGPRFAEPGSFDHEYGSKWKDLHARYRSQLTAFKLQLQLQEEELESQLEIARYERETQMLREELEKRERDKQRMKMEYELNQKQLMEYYQIRSEGLMHSQAEMNESIPVRQNGPMRRYSMNERPAYLPDMSNGFNRTDNEYGASNMENPFMVFNDLNKNNDEPSLPIGNKQILTGAFDNNFDENTIIPNKGPIEDINNGLWGRRTL